MNKEHLNEIAINVTKDIVTTLIENKQIYRPGGDTNQEDNQTFIQEVNKAYAAIYRQIYDCYNDAQQEELSPEQKKARINELIEKIKSN